MSRHGDVTLAWADGEYTFRLAIAQLRELQEKCDAGPLELYRRMFSGKWRLDDVRETIRLGLIGGGQVPPAAALKLVIRYVDDRPLMESVDVARVVLGVILLPIEDDPLKKADPAGEAKSQQNSPSPVSTEPEQQSDSPPTKSTDARSGNLQQPSRDGMQSTALQ
jgi:hypothetical protein